MHVILTTVGNLVDLPKKTILTSLKSVHSTFTGRSALVYNPVAIIGLT